MMRSEDDSTTSIVQALLQKEIGTANYLDYNDKSEGKNECGSICIKIADIANYPHIKL